MTTGYRTNEQNGLSIKVSDGDGGGSNIGLSSSGMTSEEGSPNGRKTLTIMSEDGDSTSLTSDEYSEDPELQWHEALQKDHDEQWEGQPLDQTKKTSQLPANLPIDYANWLTVSRYGLIPPGSYYAVRHGEYWVALDTVPDEYLLKPDSPKSQSQPKLTLDIQHIETKGVDEYWFIDAQERLKLYKSASPLLDRKPPGNMPKAYAYWCPSESYAAIPPGSCYTIRQNMYWVAVETIDRKYKTDALKHVQSCRIQTKPFCKSFKNITDEVIKKELLSLPMVSSPKNGWVYYSTRDNLPLNTNPANVSKTSFGVWLQTSKEASCDSEIWFPGRTVPSAELLKVTSMPRQVLRASKQSGMENMVWVPYKKDVVGIPYHKDDTVSKGMIHDKETGLLWKSYHIRTVPEGEVYFSSHKKERASLGDSTDSSEFQMSTTILSPLTMSAASGFSGYNNSTSPVSVWKSEKQIPQLPSNLPKSTILRTYWYPYLVKQHLPATGTFETRYDQNQPIYWLLITDQQARELLGGKKYPAETRPYSEIDNVKVICDSLPPSPDADVGYVYYGSKERIPPFDDLPSRVYCDRLDRYWCLTDRCDAPSTEMWFQSSRCARQKSSEFCISGLPRLPHSDLAWLSFASEYRLPVGMRIYKNTYQEPFAMVNKNKILPMEDTRCSEGVQEDDPIDFSYQAQGFPSVQDPRNLVWVCVGRSRRCIPEGSKHSHFCLISRTYWTTVQDTQTFPHETPLPCWLQQTTLKNTDKQFANISKVTCAPKNVHRIPFSSVWIPFELGEEIPMGYTTFPRLGGHIFKRGLINWVVYSHENMPRDLNRPFYEGRANTYADMLNVLSTSHLPHHDPKELQDDSSWVCFPGEEYVPEEVTVLRSVDENGCWKLLKHGIGEGFVPSKTSFADVLRITELPYDIPRVADPSKGSFWVPYPRVSQITLGYEDNVRCIVDGVVFVLCQTVPPPEKGFPADYFPSLNPLLQNTPPTDDEVDSILRRNCKNKLLAKVGSRAIKENLPVKVCIRLLKSILAHTTKQNATIDKIASNSSLPTKRWVSEILFLCQEDSRDRWERSDEVLKQFRRRNLQDSNKQLCASVANHYREVQRINGAKYVAKLNKEFKRKSSEADDPFDLSTTLLPDGENLLPTMPYPDEVGSVSDFQKKLKEVLEFSYPPRHLSKKRIFLIYLIKEAVFMAFHFRPNNYQILALLSLTDTSADDKSNIGEMKTGEGKTIVVAMAAAYEVLYNNQKVDIMTSSEILAKRDSSKMSRFFSIFNISVDHNCRQNNKSSYSSDVIYGTVSQFQFTFIRDVYMNRNHRNDRPYQTVIIDEVDNMLIDNSGQSARLSAFIPGMEQLHWIYFLIHHKMQEWGTVDPAALAQDILNHPTVHSVKHKGIRNMIDANIDTWVRSAVKSKEFTNKKEYFVRDGKVIKVDNKNTGAIQKSMVLPNGIHQFIQVREGVEVTDENMTGGFSSVLAFFQLYNRKVGLTGTIGDVDDRKEFDICYQLNFFYIPPSSVSQRVDTCEILKTTSEEEWLAAIIKNVKYESRQHERPVLIISDSIKDAELIHSCLGTDCQLYTGIQSKDEDKILQDAGKPSVVTSSTNLAGRGMDITTTPASEKNGGMHVVCTFLPINTRVEQQAAGRTARQGKKGTFHMIIRPTQSQLSRSEEQMKTTRNYIHSFRAKHKLQILIPAAQLAAQLFKSFCEVKDKFLASHDLLEKDESGGIRIKDKTQEIHSMRERWMLFIGAFQKRFEFSFNSSYSLDRTSANLTIAEFLQEQEKAFHDFKTGLETDLKHGTSIQSSIQYIAKVSSDIIKSTEQNTKLDVQQSINDIEASFQCADGPHPAAVLLHAFLKSKLPDVHTPKDVLRTLKKSLVLFVDWLDVTQYIQGVVPKDTRLKLLIDIIKEQVDSLQHVITDVKSWMRTSKSSQSLSSILRFTKNKQKVFAAKNVGNPLTASTNSVNLKRIGITGKLESKLHETLFSDLNRSKLVSMGVRPHEQEKRWM
eukprot:TRINITY_DN14739_c0_g1_i1.p1 TRINITY_DN14739_c0_g1~~TRINITY_DN14739_c0_g1_i1.p1  ORF type:complete len:1998 (+),score=286.25 TRINITY_DN14739_c0_g1_i1:39-6032(+)